MRARPLYVKVCIKWLITLFLDVRRTDVLLIALKLRETRPMGLKLTCAPTLLTYFKIKGLILICLYHCLVTNTGGLLPHYLKRI